MTKTEFLNQLYNNLSPLLKKDKEKTISYYQELIDDQIESGKSEKEIIEKLGSPILIANKIKVELDEKDQIVETKQLSPKKSKPGTVIAIILGFPIWFSLLISLFAVIFSVFVSIFAVLISLYASSFAVSVYGIVQIVACFFYFGISPVYAFSILGMGLVAIGLSILVFFATLYLTKYTIKFTKWFFKQCKKSISKMGGKK